DGDRAPLPEIVKLKKDFGAQLFLDEAHAVGVIGRNGRGLAFEENLSREVDVQMGTLSKALGVSGGYICGSRNMTEWLINRARSFIFSTAPPPALAAAARTAVDFLSSKEGEKRRQRLRRNIFWTFGRRRRFFAWRAGLGRIARVLGHQALLERLVGRRRLRSGRTSWEEREAKQAESDFDFH